MDDTDRLIGAAAGIGIATFIFAVVWQGNTKELGAMLFKEEGYIEFLVALFLLGLLMKYGPTSKITDLFVVMAVLAVLFKVASNVNFGTTLSDFASGKTNMLNTVKALFGATTQ